MWRCVVLGLALAACGSADPLPELMPIAPFALTDQNGHPFGTEQLRGKVWIANVFFTSCPDVCPLQTSQLANLSRRLPHRDDLRLVSISVDPEVDTPERLHDYAARYRADERWSFLTGDRHAVSAAVERSLRLPMGEREGTDHYSISHASRFLLIDRHAMLRGLYTTDGEGLDGLTRDVPRLLEEP